MYINSYSYESTDISATIETAKADLNRNQEIVIFDSKNPFSFNDLLFRYKYIANQKVYAILTIPNKDNLKVSLFKLF